MITGPSGFQFMMLIGPSGVQFVLLVINPFYSQVKFVIPLTINHTILIMLVLRI